MNARSALGAACFFSMGWSAHILFVALCNPSPWTKPEMLAFGGALVVANLWVGTMQLRKAKLP